MKIIQHLKEARNRIANIMIFFTVFFITLFSFSKQVITYLLTHYGINVVSLNPLDSLMAQMIFAGMTSLIIIMPIILYHLYKYVQPEGLLKKIYLKLCLCSILAITGFSFGVMYFSKVLLQTLSTTSIVPIMWSIRSLFNFAIGISFALALATQLIIIIPATSPFIDYSFIRRHRFATMAGVFILSAIITPPDIFSQIIIGLPLILCLEIGLLFSKKYKQTEMV